MSGAYDFRTLSPLDFEELVRDLLQAEWGRRLESFGPGPDGGMDIRLLDCGGKTVVQAKHLAASGYAALRRAVALERPKALKLAPHRYVLATSVPMTAARKDELVATMDGVPLAPCDVLGQEDLNGMLARSAGIERRHFKLWLSSTAVLERILHSGVYNRTDAEMDIIRELVPRFVQNESVAAAERLLGERGSLIIAGPPGVGKTTLARMLVWLHAEQGWNIRVTDSIEEAISMADPAEKRLVLLDDFLGQVRLSADHVRGVDARLPPLLARAASHRNLRFILTTRDYILAQARRMSGRLASGRIDAAEYVLDVGRYTRAARARILYNHIHFSALPPAHREGLLADDLYLRIIDHKNFNPRLVEQMTVGGLLDMGHGTVAETVAKVLSNPEMLWDIPWREHIGPDARLLMIAMFANGRGATVEALRGTFLRVAKAHGRDIHPAEAEGLFRSTFRSLDGSVLAVVDGTVQFANPGLRDFLQGVVTGDGLVPLLAREAATHAELKELFDVHIAAHPDDDEDGPQDLAETWAGALERSRGTCDRYDHAAVAVRIAEAYDHPQVDARLDAAIADLEVNDAGDEETGSVCAMLELGFSNNLRPAASLRFARAAARLAVTLLEDEGRRLNFEDLQSLVDGLNEYCGDPATARRGTERGMACLLEGLDEEVRNYDTVEELDDFEEDLLKFLGRHHQPTTDVIRAIGYRRENLESDGRVRERSNYSSGGIGGAVRDASDDELRSMFAGLRAS